MVSSATVDAAVAAILLAVGSSIRGNLLFLLGLPLTLYGAVIAVRAAMAASRTPALNGPEQWQRRMAFWLAVTAAASLGISSLQGPLWFEISHRAYGVAGLVAVGIWGAGPSPASRRAVSGLLVFAALLHLVTPLALSRPEIDVWWWTQTAVRALLDGINPYVVQAVDPQRGGFNYGYDLRVYPYTPATLLVFAPAVLLVGDYRFLLAICLPATALLVRAAGQRLRTNPHFMDAIVLALLLHPRSVFFTAFGWAEAVLVLIAAAFVYLFARAPDGAGQAIAFFLLPALKQYFAVPAVLYLATRPPRPPWRALLAGLSVAAATMVPFLAWDYRSVLDGIVFQMRELRSPRVDSHSIVAIMALAGVSPISRWWSVVAQVAVGGVAWWRLHPLGLAGLLLSSALALTATFLVGWQAFFNYYYLVAVLMLLAAMVLASPGDEG